MTDIFRLLILFQTKHFLADYSLQVSWMLGKFKETGWVLPLAAHAGVHGVFTFLISLMFVGIPTALLCAVIDTVLHFIFDRIKASPNLLGQFQALSKQEFSFYVNQKKTFELFSDKFAKEKDGLQYHVAYNQGIQEIDERFRSNKIFWSSLGFDQFLHHLTHYGIIAILVAS